MWQVNWAEQVEPIMLESLVFLVKLNRMNFTDVVIFNKGTDKRFNNCGFSFFFLNGYLSEASMIDSKYALKW